MVSMKMIIWSHFKQTDSDLVRGRSRDQNTVFFFKVMNYLFLNTNFAFKLQGKF